METLSTSIFANSYQYKLEKPFIQAEEKSDKFSLSGVINLGSSNEIPQFKKLANSGDPAEFKDAKPYFSTHDRTLIIADEKKDFKRFFSVPKEKSGLGSFIEEFTFQLDENDDIIHIDYAVEPQDSDSNVEDMSKYETRVEIVKIKEGPSPRIKKPVVIDSRTGKVEQPEKKGFLATYWYIILPVVLLLMFSGGSE
ncbi:hypothetical protein BB560_002723 [Smittium megazygosporum]|uniref:Uncharacterized protein n=1 Tax=Smittium megazygosporum TaxID=133381 RepID=A0A2T9ZDX5_9FUNG|nr:hypothetical protein BB560_002723 [Smittium megazygosporum]